MTTRIRNLRGIPRLAACAALALSCSAEAAAPPEDAGATNFPSLWAQRDGERTTRSGAEAAGTPEAAEAAIKANRSYGAAAAGVAGFNLLLNAFDRAFLGSDYETNLSTIHRNMRRGWVEDRDSFTINQFGHPYQGSMYHGFARSAGLGYWESLPFTIGGSAMWEIAGETTPPSRNDLITTGIGGSFVGEALFRIASLVLEKADGTPSFWRETAAAAISPATGFNRFAYGERFRTVFPSRDPAYYARLQAGPSIVTQDEPGRSGERKRHEMLADFSIDYGLPGKPGYRYTRPFDYFSFQAIGSSAVGFESVTTRGLLVGTDYAAGERYRGIWGLYGSYDYIAPQFFRVSSTALSLGTTGQWWASPSVAIQGTGMAGAGYASVGTVSNADERDNRYGVAPQALLALRFIFGDRASLDLSAREYFVSSIGAGRGGHDNIARGDASFTVRANRNHAVSVKYLVTRRDASPLPGGTGRSQSRATIGIFYTLLGQDRFGAVDWRKSP